jgi:hypothetical protein
MQQSVSTSKTLVAAQALAVDAVSAEIVESFRHAGVDSILLKGPALARLLYRRELRGYVDTDLLVHPGAVEQAARLLAAKGFEELPLTTQPELGLPHARPWVRTTDNAEVDLHALIAGVGVAPSELWDILAPRTETMRIATVDCRVLVPHALLVVTALHAAQHGAEEAKTLEDLRRAVADVPEEEWRRAAELAGRLDATGNFSSALRFLPDGAALADRLGLPSAELVDSARDVHSATRLAMGFHRLAAAGGWRERLSQVRREVAPSPEHMRWWSRLARRGRLGLVAAYAWRVVQLAWRTPPSLLAWRRARRR